MEEGGCRSTYIGYVTTHHSGWLPGSRDIVVSLLYTRRSSFHITTRRDEGVGEAGGLNVIFPLFCLPSSFALSGGLGELEMLRHPHCDDLPVWG